MSSTTTPSSTSSHSAAPNEPPRPVAAIRAALAEKRRQIGRACDVILAPARDAILGGRRRDNRGNVVRLLERFLEQERLLEEELEWVEKRMAIEWWLGNVWKWVGTWGEEE
jgi:hypothetical protein